jgi:uncharacterized pyridoxal phosphate-containing UPF0001 family protein
VSSIDERVWQVRDRIVAAAQRIGRDPDDVRLIAVTKGFGAGEIRAAAAAGVRDIGENRVQEANRKRADLSDIDVTWHLIGHLQSNKAARAAALFDAIHSLDSARIAGAVGAARDPDLDPIAGLIEVELTGIEPAPGVARRGRAGDALAAARALHGDE